MTGGYCYGDLEPKERCPYCGTKCFADFVDIGVGFQQCGPFHCEACGASEIGAYDKDRVLTAEERKCGWYAPHSPAGSSANVDEDGKHIAWHEADTLYRVSLGVKPRYTKHGRLIDNG